MDFADDGYYGAAMGLGLPAFAPIGATNLWARDREVQKQFETGGTHQPDVFTLPRDHEVTQQAMLNPCEDLEFLLGKFQRDVAAVMGIPEEMVRSQGSGQETVRKTMATGRLFTANMNDACRLLADLLRTVYKKIYHKDNVEFILLPMPRLEVESMQDLKVLFEVGALTPDMSLQMSQILLGEDMDNKRRKVQLERAAAQQQQQLELQQGGQGEEGEGGRPKPLGRGEVEAMKGPKAGRGPAGARNK